jgi:hypothetical protein
MGSLYGQNPIGVLMPVIAPGEFPPPRVDNLVDDGNAQIVLKNSNFRGV